MAEGSDYEVSETAGTGSLIDETSACRDQVAVSFRNGQLTGLFLISPCIVPCFPMFGSALQPSLPGEKILVERRKRKGGRIWIGKRKNK